MAMTFKQFMDKLGVGYALQPYETFPWSHYDGDEDLTVNAAVAVNSDGDEVEAEIMYLTDTPSETQAPVKLVFWAKIVPHTGDQWKMSELKIHGEDHKNKNHSWEANSCDVFRRCAHEIHRGQIPDFDEIFDQEFNKGGAGGKRGGKGGGKKSPNIRPETMPGMGRKV